MPVNFGTAMSAVLTYRELALRQAISQVGVHERGFSNRGPEVDEYQREGAAYVGWVGFAWCAAFVYRNFKRAGYPVENIPNRASVEYARQYARREGWVVDRPLRADIVSYEFTGDGWLDHTGHVEKILRLGPVLYLQTIEGNTSSGTGGSQSDGGGVYRRRRFVRRSSVVFTRIPGSPPQPRPKPPKPKPDFWAWVRWWRGVGEFKKYGPRSAAHRPDVPKKIPAAWWKRLKLNIGGKAK